MLLKLHRLKLNRRTLLIAAGAAGIICCLFYVALFAFPKQVTFSYAGPTCTSEFTLLPNLHRAAGSTGFKLSYEGELLVGKLKLAATKLCFAPVAAPQKGTIQIASAPWGGWIFRSHHRLMVSEPPRLLGVAAQPAQPLGRPLALKLSQPDAVFQYTLEIDDKNQLCALGSTKLLCNVDRLGLKQGTSYTLKLQRSFGGKKAGKPIDIQIAILPATKVLDASIKPDEMLYGKPRSVEIKLDKTLVTAAAKLDLVEGDKATAVNTQAKVDGMHVILAWNEDLPREKTFRITLTSAVTSDGSMLENPYVLQFKTSGGPKVLGASIGGSSVAGDARVVVTFDQALSNDANVVALASISGGSANISRQGSNQVVFALHDMPACGAFTLTIARGAVSASGITGNAAWSQASRITCRRTRTIGYSVKGRPIQAYYYGTGSNTILFTGGIHGDERSGVYIMQDWATYLDANAYKLPANKQIVIVPSVNPDGVAVGQRYNANNVNIDRNFPSSDWISDISVASGQVLPRGGGAAPLSEPETRALADLSRTLQLRAAISFHSSGAVLGANKVADSVAIGTQYARGVGYGTVFAEPEATFGYTLTGELETWVGEKFGTPAILVELPTSTGRYFSRHQATLWNMTNL